jgi:hypothetical protein
MSYAFGFGFFLTTFSMGALTLLNYLDHLVEQRSANDVINESHQVFDIGEVWRQTRSDVESLSRVLNAINSRSFG